MKKLISIFMLAIFFTPAYARPLLAPDAEMLKMSKKDNAPVAFSHDDDEPNSYSGCLRISPDPSLFNREDCPFHMFRLDEPAQSMAVYILREEMNNGKLTEKVIARVDEEGDLEYINNNLGKIFRYTFLLPLPDPMVANEFKKSRSVAMPSPYPWEQSHLYGGSNGFLLIPTDLDLFNPSYYKAKYEFVINGKTYSNRRRLQLTYDPQQDPLDFLGSLANVDDPHVSTKGKGANVKGSVIEQVPGTNAYKTKAHRLELIDALGRILKSVEGPEKPLTIEEAGAYYLRAREKNGRVAGSKGVIKTR